MYVLDNSKTCHETILTMDSWAAWSFCELAEGRWFDRDPWGKPLADRASIAGKQIAAGWRGIVVVFRGDEKYTQKVFRMRVGWSSDQICWHCCASKVTSSRNLYTTFGPCAPHRSTMISLEDFIQHVSRANPWIALPGFHPNQLIYDVLHVFDLALVCDAAASVARLYLKLVDFHIFFLAHEYLHAHIL